MRTKVLVTGCNGFVGQHVLSKLHQLDYETLPVSRNSKIPNALSVGELNGQNDWSRTLKGCKTVIHLAGRAHLMSDHSHDAAKAFLQVNTEATLNLCRQAILAGVKRFIFISSIKVNGESTQPDNPFRHSDEANPQDHYAYSKHQAELGLQKMAIESAIEVVIIRPPMVYGLGAKGNFETLRRAIKRGIPLPLKSINHNKRSLVAIQNLSDLIIRCVEHPNAVNQVFLVSDNEDVSTAQLARYLVQAMGRPKLLIPCPHLILTASGRLLGKSAMVSRLTENMQLDIEHTCKTLDWTPPLSTKEGIIKSVNSTIY